MNTCKEYIREYASSHEVFDKTGLWEWLERNGETGQNTMTCMLTQMVEAGELCRVSRGNYSLPSVKKSSFSPVVEEDERVIFSKLRLNFPFATFCIYNGRSLSPLQHHVSENNVTYVETERYAVESVFDYLKGEEYIVWQNPDEDFIYKYVDLKARCVIVKPLVTESPMEKVDSIPVPTLEKILVDIEKDPCFGYLRGTESNRMWENARQMFNINGTRLNRYAHRRGLKVESMQTVW